MAEYYIAPKSSFDATADAIREKTGSQATIEWTEDGFADAVAAIPSGGSSNWTLLGSHEYEVTTTSSTVGTVGTFTVSGISSSKYIYARVRDKAGKRNGYLYGTDSFGIITDSRSLIQTIAIKVDSSGNYGGVANKYGVFLASASVEDDTVTISKRYNATNTGAIDGTYVVEIYALDPPTDKPIYT